MKLVPTAEGDVFRRESCKQLPPTAQMSKVLDKELICCMKNVTVLDQIVADQQASRGR